MLTFFTGSPKSDRSDKRFWKTPWYYEVRSRCWWIADQLRIIFEERGIPWLPAIDELVERMTEIDGFLASERIERQVIRRMVVVEDKLNAILQSRPGHTAKEVFICKDNFVAIRFDDDYVECLNADFAVRTSRSRWRRNAQEELDHTLKLNPKPVEEEE